MNMRRFLKTLKKISRKARQDVRHKRTNDPVMMATMALAAEAEIRMIRRRKRGIVALRDGRPVYGPKRQTRTRGKPV